jgi:hypothetical protein
MPPQISRGLCIVYVGSRDSDQPVDMQIAPTASLETAARTARSKVEMMAFASTRAEQRPIGFVIENGEGDELYRWYSQAS